MNREVVKDMTDTQHTIGMEAEQQRSVQEISQLFEIAGREGEVIAGLTGGMDQLRAVQAAKHALATLTPAEVRAAMAYRRAARRTMQPGLAQSAGQPSGRPARELS
ncbi:hypothetical protein [Nocardioides psychrotolerans]|uniref:hypothetical protein n=1 Tax=Nocardioides psychrotolerans TaxID=1005945 RepID=UPI0031380643